MDVILVAPQVCFKKRGIIKQTEPCGMIVLDIDTIAYGMVDGKKIFDQVLEALENKLFLEITANGIKVFLVRFAIRRQAGFFFAKNAEVI